LLGRPTQDNVPISVRGLTAAGRGSTSCPVDRAHIAQTSKDFPDDLNNDLVRPAVQGIVYPLFARYSVREIFSGRRAEIQQEITKELKPRLAARGLLLRGVDMGQVDLPSDYRAGMEKLLAEELETEKVRYTLKLNTPP
jgi:regulator of protease activity HflC (stomatin/prohibitin superfamily)